MWLALLLACGTKTALGAAPRLGASGGPRGPTLPLDGPDAGTEGPADTALTGELAIEGPVGKRISTSPAELVVFYGSEHMGSLEPCGCPHRPRGSLSRATAYVNASRAANPTVPSVLVHGGYWLQDAMGFDGKLRTDVALGNHWMVEGLRAGGWDALNVGTNDLAGLATLPADEGPPLPLVSANATGPHIAKWIVVHRGGLRVGITGITGRGETLTTLDGYAVTPPEDAGPVLDALAAESDVVVLLAYQATEAAKALAQGHAVDVVVDANLHREWQAPFYVGHAAWVLAQFQTLRLGELRLRLTKGAVTGGLGRQIDLDPEMPDDPVLLAIQKQARTALDAAQRAIYGP
jgi:2',3'-cyclic-nucleotide 2'-phosphodiesterase (5'-nucleotidase family)